MLSSRRSLNIHSSRDRQAIIAHIHSWAVTRKAGPLSVILRFGIIPTATMLGVLLLLISVLTLGLSPRVLWQSVLDFLPFWLGASLVCGVYRGWRYWRKEEQFYLHGLEVETYQAALDEAGRVPEILPHMVFQTRYDAKDGGGPSEGRG